MGNWNFHNWGMPMMWLIWIPILILVVWLVVFLTNKRTTFISPGKEKESPLEILERRYARGEITKEEFEERRSVILEKNQGDEEES